MECLLGRRLRLEQGTPLVSRFAVRWEETRHCPGPWEGNSGLLLPAPGTGQVGLRPKGRGRRSAATSGGGHLALSLDTMSWTAPWLGWLTGNSGWQRVWAACRLGGRAAWPEQRTCSYNLSCHLGGGEDQFVWEGGRGPGTLWGPQQSLPTLCLSFPILLPIANHLS